MKELDIAIQKDNLKGVKKIIDDWIKHKNKNDLDELLTKIKSGGLKNGLIIKELVKGYFRLKRKGLKDTQPMKDFSLGDSINIQESLLEVLGYDKMVPTKEEQSEIISKYINFGDDTDYKYYTDPRYGLAAACAGWDQNIVKDFLEKCMIVPDAPLKYVAKNSLKQKYIKLR